MQVWKRSKRVSNASPQYIRRNADQLRLIAVCYAIQLKIMEYGDRPDVLERFAKRALEESEEAGRDAGDAGAEEGQRGGDAHRRGGNRGRGRGRGGASGQEGPPRKKVMTESSKAEAKPAE